MDDLNNTDLTGASGLPANVPRGTPGGAFGSFEPGNSPTPTGQMNAATNGSVQTDGSAMGDSTPVTGMPVPATPPPITISSNTDTDMPMSEHSPEIAEDNDLIEQEWVHKAKEIVEHTREDPFEQSVEIGKFKADYIKKRYKRDIKIAEG